MFRKIFFKSILNKFFSVSHNSFMNSVSKSPLGNVNNNNEILLPKQENVFPQYMNYQQHTQQSLELEQYDSLDDFERAIAAQHGGLTPKESVAVAVLAAGLASSSLLLSKN